MGVGVGVFCVDGIFVNEVVAAAAFWGPVSPV